LTHTKGGLFMGMNICSIVKVPLYYSGFCLTDNKTFCEFYIRKFPKLNQKFESFEFTEKTLSFDIGNEIVPTKIQKKVYFGDFLLDNSDLFDYFVDKYKEVKYFWLNKWLGDKRSGFIGIVKDGKMVGLFKTRKRRLANGIHIEEERKSIGKEVVSERKISSKKG
jgi:hypothetical protein